MPASPEPGVSRAERRVQRRRRRRNRWIVLVVVIVAIAAAVAVGILLTRDDATTRSTTTTTTVPATSAAATARALYAAWQDQDRDAAATLATAEVVQQLFAIDPQEGQGLEFTSCSADGEHRVCVWSRPGGDLTFTVSKAGSGFRVTAVALGPAGLPPDSTSTTTSTTTAASSTPGTSTTTLPMPTDPEGFATTLFATWRVGNQLAAASVATPDGVAQMFSVPYPGNGSAYTFAGCKGADGNAECTFRGDGVPKIVMTVPIAGGGVPAPITRVTRFES